jgi:hypothetical protein
MVALMLVANSPQLNEDWRVSTLSPAQLRWAKREPVNLPGKNLPNPLKQSTWVPHHDLLKSS